MGRDEEAARIFRVLLLEAKPAERTCAVEALQAAARITVWQRDQSCGSAIAAGRIGCLLTGVVRKYSVRPDGHRQIIDILIAGDFIGLVPCNDSFLVEAVSDDTRIASFRPDQVTSLASDHPVIARMLHERLAAALRRLEDHLLVQSRINRDRQGRRLSDAVARPDPAKHRQWAEPLDFALRHRRSSGAGGGDGQPRDEHPASLWHHLNDRSPPAGVSYSCGSQPPYDLRLSFPSM